MHNKTTNIFEEGLLKFLDEKQLKKIQSMKIGIGGAGGLGSNVAMILVRSGFIHLEIIDHDVIEPSNLNRQQYFIDEVGQSKVSVLKDRLYKINPELNVVTHNARWEAKHGNPFQQSNEIIVEAFDQASFKHQFVEYYIDKAKYVISGNGMAGLTQKEPMKVRKMGNLYMVGDTTTDAACGHPPMAPRVTACAAMMAEIVLDLTLGIE